VFKGSGFYCTDNGRTVRDTANRKNGDKELKAEPKTEKKTESQSDSKPQTATATKSEENA
jgi:hypothetical protein